MTEMNTRLENTFSEKMLAQFYTIAGIKAKKSSAKTEEICKRALNGEAINRSDAIYLTTVDSDHITPLLQTASNLRDLGKGRILTFSRNVFVPVTRICRDRCGYCTFKIEPGEGDLFMSAEEVLDIARKGAQLGCTELLFVTGDKPELKYKVYRDALRSSGYETTADYLIDLGKKGLEENIFPHTNLGLSTADELIRFRDSNPSMGLMLENISDRLLHNGEAHHGCPDKVPRLRMKTMETAGELRIPWTTGILVGIGETWDERIDSLFAIKELNDRYGHVQEIIIQNFSPKVGIRMEGKPSPEFTDMIKLVAVARLIFGHEMNIQVPPNLNMDTYTYFTVAGINDLGGVSPLTIDYVNPEAPWPQIEIMEKMCKDNGFELRERLPVYPEFINDSFIDDGVLKIVRRFVDSAGLVPTQEVINGRN